MCYNSQLNYKAGNVQHYIRKYGNNKEIINTMYTVYTGIPY